MPRRGASARRDPRNLFRLLRRHGYALNAVEEITSLCRYRGCHGLAGRGFLTNVSGGRMERLDHTVASIGRTGRPTFTFHHVLLPHSPWIYLPSGLRYDAGEGDYRKGITGPPGFHDRFLTLHSEQRYLLQLAAVDLALGRLLRRLRETGLYHEALVVITADHGIAFQTGVADRRKVTAGNVDEIAPVPMFVKLPGQATGLLDRSYVRTVDIMPTIARWLRIRVPWRVDGHPVWSRTARRRRGARVVTRSLRRSVTIGARSLERRRRVNLRARIRRLGFGWGGGLLRIGPHPELLGRSTARFASRRRRGLRAVLRAGWGVRSVDRRTGLVPALVAGRIVGDRGRHERNLAVSVNSRIWAVGRSFHLRGKRGEHFSVIVPEEALHEGGNRLALFEVRGGRLRRLATVR